jgi:hypothetical protein
MYIRRPDREARQRRLGELLSGPTEIDVQIEQHNLAANIAGGPIDGAPEFRQHECWRMLQAYPDSYDETLPGELVCAGCSARFRAELEWRP